MAYRADISIHAPRMGSDCCARCSACSNTDFNPRSPDGERQVGDAAALFEDAFQSTLPGWGATYTAVCLGVSPYISIHAPRMGSDGHHGPLHQQPRKISIHAPRMGSDYSGDASLRIMLNFNPRSPDGERRCRRTPRTGGGNFNPRSPDGERPNQQGHVRFTRDFNPRSPDGERRQPAPHPSQEANFNPRSPDGERQDHQAHRRTRKGISIHAPRMGSDLI